MTSNGHLTKYEKDLHGGILTVNVKKHQSEVHASIAQNYHLSGHYSLARNVSIR